VDPLDGNAIAGQLFAVFGNEMTTAVRVCATCGARGPVAELEVYLRGPGTVVRCRSCRNVQMVLVEVRGVACVDLRGLAALEPAGPFA
jgi:ribosomal protein L40E